MLRFVLLLCFVAAAASQIPYVMGLTRTSTASQEATLAMPPTSGKGAGITGGSGVTLSADARGHFQATFRLNGKPVEGLVDTGASSIAINETTAKRLGFSSNSLDYRYAISTANGSTKGALVRLDRVEIGSIRVTGVDAMVLKDDALSGTLIGMSFLKRLSSFQVADGSLKLVP